MKVILEKVKQKLEDFSRKLFRYSQTNSQSLQMHKVETTRQQNFMSDYAVVSQMEYDAFRMKAIVLLKQDAKIASFVKTLIKEDPMQVKVGARENQKMVVQLSQRFECQGRFYLVEGEFLRDATKKIQSIPVSKSFKITQSNIQ